MPLSHDKRALPTRRVAERYGVSPRTVKRWQTSGVLPPPDLTVNLRHYWFLTTLEQTERSRIAGQAIDAPQRKDAS
jgi:DNA-binding transcriptional MerR regulator